MDLDQLIALARALSPAERTKLVAAVADSLATAPPGSGAPPPATATSIEARIEAQGIHQPQDLAALRDAVVWPDDEDLADFLTRREADRRRQTVKTSGEE